MSDDKLFKARELTSVCCVNEEGRASNLASVLARGLPSCTMLPARDGPLAVVASGPSVRDHLDELDAWPGEVWAINGAYDYLLDQGIVPQGFFAIDPLPGLAQYVERAHPDTTFYIASTCDPSVFDNLRDHKVLLFHPADDGMTHKPEYVIGGGTTAMTRVPFLALLQGWRDITVFGADSSFDGGQYCYQWGRYATDIDTPKMLVEINGEGPFETELGLLKQVSQLGVLHKRFKGKLKFKCAGLMAAFLRSPEMDDSVIDVEQDERSDAA